MSMDNLTIRPGIATDLSRLMQLDHSCASEYVWQLDFQKDSEQIIASFRKVRLPREVRVLYPRRVDTLADLWNRQPGLVALLSSTPVGYIRMLEQTSAGTVWITDVVVASSVRRQGIGSSLIRAAQDWAIERGAQRIMLEMQSKSYPAICLAQSLGFDFCGYNDQYYASQDVTLFFGRALK